MTERRLLMIPGPIELEPEVLRALGTKTTSHLDPDFIGVFSRALTRTRETFLAPDGQPFIIAGSGTLAMEMGVANIVEPGDAALVVDTGYFSARMATILERLGARVTRVSAPLGGCPEPAEVERALAGGKFKLVTITHVDTSTGVRAPVEALARVAQAQGALVVVDGVCSVGGEELRQTAWGVDVVLTGSQKALGVPPGLALVVAGPRALAAHRARRTPVTSLYLDWDAWLPVMEAYEGNRPKYFATPAVNHLFALETSLRQLLAEGMDARFERHARLAKAARAGLSALGLRFLPTSEAITANTMTAVWLPEGIGPELVGRARAEGVVLAGGLHPDAATRYFRIGHMGAVTPGDILTALGAVERALAGAGYRAPGGAPAGSSASSSAGSTAGAAVAAAQGALVDLR